MRELSDAELDCVSGGNVEGPARGRYGEYYFEVQPNGNPFYQGDHLIVPLIEDGEYVILAYDRASFEPNERAWAMAWGAAGGALTGAVAFGPLGAAGGPAGVAAAALSGAFFGAATGALTGLAVYEGQMAFQNYVGSQ